MKSLKPSLDMHHVLTNLKPCSDSSKPKGSKSRFFVSKWPMLSLLALWTTFACAGRIPDSSDTASTYKEALTQNKPKTIYNLLSKKTQSTLSYERFEVLWRKNHKERAQQAARVEPAQSSETLYVSNSRLVLTLNNNPNRWGIAGHAFHAQGAKTVKATAYLLHRKLNQANFEPIFNLLTQTKREPIAKEFLDFKNGLEESLKNDDSVYPLDDTKAHYRFATERRRYKLTFIKATNGTWAIDDINFLPSVSPPSGSTE